MTTYFVSPSGSNSNSGTSSGSPWQTVGKVNSTSLNPGDSVLFQGGQTFSGTTLALTSAGTALNPITIGSYGTGNATFSNGTGGAVTVTGAGGYIVENLNITGISGSTTQSGIQFFASGTGSLPAIQVLSCTVTGWQYGLSIGGSGATDGWNGITITGGSYNGNVYSGIIIYGAAFNHSSPAYNHAGLTISNLDASLNLGSAPATGQATGFGINCGSVNGGTISGVTAHGNGTSNGDTTNGPVGIMAYASSGVTITGCVAYSNGTGTAADGDGIDLDVDCNGCTVEYCISYSNAGSGILAWGGTSDTYWGSVTPNVIRWNLCWGNGTNGAANGNYHGDLTLGANLSGLQAYNNTLVSRTSGSAQPAPLSVPTSNTFASVTVRNCVFYSGSTAIAATAASAYSTSALLLQGNCYFCAGTFGIKWGGTTYASLAAFRAGQAGQESYSGSDTGLQANPALAAPASAPSVTTPSNLAPAAVLELLRPGSPCATAGLDLQADFSISPGTRDFFGTTLTLPLPVGGSQAFATSGTPQVLNQWSGTFSQPVSFQVTPPALQSVVVALTPGNSVGGGSGTPTAGNWLFCLVAMNEPSTAAGFTVGVGDDIHSFWRPGNETTSTWAVSTGTALTRTAIWYTPNTARAVGNVYVAPDGAFDALAVLVIEVAGLGPWDTVTGINTNYAAAATTLGLALGAPSGAAFLLGATGGDSTTATQAFAPASWTALHSVAATNGTDHTSDAELTSAWFTTSGSVSVSGTAGSATNLSGALIGVLQAAPSPVPAAQNPNWPFLKFEAALGAGFQTPPDQYTWTDLSSRAWSWDETTGIQFQLGEIQATDLTLEADNFDGFLSSDNASGPYYPDLVSGTPLRIRAAIGTIAGVTVNRWYVIQRNLHEWPQEITDGDRRRFIPGTGTDIWSALSAAGPTPYRGEVEQDSPYAWWPCDDQPGTGGTLPVVLRNAAAGNAVTLSITASPNGVSAQDTYSSGLGGTGGAGGTDLTTGAGIGTNPTPAVAVYAVAASPGWMFGDPSSSPQTSSAGSLITASPGSAAWQQTGGQGNTGAHGWFLTGNDASFPNISGGITVEGWFNYAFLGTTAGYQLASGTFYNEAGQPYCPLTLLELATASAPVAVLQLDISGHLNLITYNSGTGTTHSVYSTSDLRCSGWFQVTVTLTGSAWAVHVNGTLTASASGSATISPTAWTWLIVNGDLGTGGGSTLTGIVHGGNVSASHIAVYPQILPKWRILAHYAAAVTGFGALPAPTLFQLTSVENSNGTGFTPDGTEFQGSYGAGQTTFTFSGLAAAVAGSYTSGPSARSVIAGIGLASPTVHACAVWAQWVAVAPLVQVFTNASANAETEAAACLGAGDSFTTGFGAGATGGGVSQVSSGTGASPPASPSALGDTAGQRLERIMSYGGITWPGRCIDPASLLVQAATDIGGQQAGPNLENIASSDGGMLYIDNLGNLTYWQKSHLASQYSSPVWTIGPAASGAAVVPYDRAIRWTADPQRVWNAITIQPFAPDGASLPLVTPASASAVASSQQQYGAQPKRIVSYLQSVTEMQSYADWLLTNFGQARIRVENVKIDAAAYPAAWSLVLGVNCGDVVSVQNWQIGGGGITGTFRVTEITRKISFGARGADPEASVTLTCDFEPASYWS